MRSLRERVFFYKAKELGDEAPFYQHSTNRILLNGSTPRAWPLSKMGGSWTILWIRKGYAKNSAAADLARGFD